MCVDACPEMLFMKLRENFLDLQTRYGNENHPPPWQTFVLKPEFGPGNMHMIQKVFEGSFEVCPPATQYEIPRLIRFAV
jgi:hypothetical protein